MIEAIKTMALATEFMLTGFIAFLTFLVLVAFVSIARRPDGTAVWHLAASFVVLAFAVGGRMAYWALVAQPIRAEVGKGIPNSLFGMVMIYGLYLVLKFLWLIIPDEDRHRYTIWTAPWYPHNRDWRMGWVLQMLRKRKEP